MVAGARTFSLEETFLSPQILNPPPTRHALLAFLLALAALLHIGTTAWGDLFDGVEGQFAGAAREMVISGNWLVPTNDGAPVLDTPPLAYWAVTLSCKAFGISAAAARLPNALATIGTVALTFLIAERLAGYWRGFAAGLIYLCSTGVFLVGRMVARDAICGLFVCASIYCVVRGYQHQKFRRLWFAGFWFGVALAFLTKGAAPLLVLAGTVICLTILFREARLRFRPLLHWTNLLLLVLIVAPWFAFMESQFPGFLSRFATRADAALALPRWELFLLHLARWFPAIFLVLPGLLFAPRKILRPDEVTFADRLPICWLMVTLGIALIFGDEASTALLCAFALFAACAWERTSRPLRAVGIGLSLAAGLAAAGVIYFRPAILGMPTDAEIALSLRPLAQFVIVSFLIFAVGAFFAIRQRGEITLVLALAAMVPAGCCLVEGRARVASFFSLADAAKYLNPRLGRSGEVIFEGSLRDGSSLSFYLEKKFFFVGQPPGFFERDDTARRKYLDEHFLLDAWDRSDPLYLIIDEKRVAHWRQLITDRVHIYHQVTTCGSRVILSNQL
ncbi:MAG TPA: glycosyltransferase family 39 protein [Chthoniobacterales bacterium]|nr:glycosyltransferase family 39 protein [Chthoniobacterales bacterium]